MTSKSRKSSSDFVLRNEGEELEDGNGDDDEDDDEDDEEDEGLLVDEDEEEDMTMPGCEGREDVEDGFPGTSEPLNPSHCPRSAIIWSQITTLNHGHRKSQDMRAPNENQQPFKYHTIRSTLKHPDTNQIYRSRIVNNNNILGE